MTTSSMKWHATTIPPLPMFHLLMESRLLIDLACRPRSSWSRPTRSCGQQRTDCKRQTMLQTQRTKSFLPSTASYRYICLSFKTASLQSVLLCMMHTVAAVLCTAALVRADM